MSKKDAMIQEENQLETVNEKTPEAAGK